MPTIWEQTRDGLTDAIERSRESQRAFQSAYAMALVINDHPQFPVYYADELREWARDFTAAYPHLWGVTANA